MNNGIIIVPKEREIKIWQKKKWKSVFKRIRIAVFGTSL